jgi:hypothetical protein
LQRKSRSKPQGGLRGIGAESPVFWSSDLHGKSLDQKMCQYDREKSPALLPIDILQEKLSTHSTVGV